MGDIVKLWARRAAWWAVAACLAGPGASAALGQAPAAVVSPISIESDHNGVNLATGQMTIDRPALSVPAAPNLRFDRVQNAAPMITGTITGSVPRISNFRVHTGAGAAETFHCEQAVCAAGSYSGSVFLPAYDPNVSANPVWEFRQAGTGIRYYFDVRYNNSSGQKREITYYASRVVWPNGEVITYTYDLGGLTGLSYALRRPTRIASNMGYQIDLTYPVQYADEDLAGWLTPNSATLYRTAEPTVPLRRLTYAGGVTVTVTDSGSTVADPSDDRTYICTGCGGALPDQIERVSGSLQLPGEGSPALQVAPQPSSNLIQTVTRDGVPWTYTYNNAHQLTGNPTWLYDSVTVTGPNGFNRTYSMTTGGSAPFGTYNIVNGVTDALQRTTSYVIDTASGRPMSVTYPEGNMVSVQYDDAGNVVSRTMQAKPGSGTLPASITEQAHYALPGAPQFCDTACWRADWVRDGMQRQTDYLYNSQGQVTVRTEPADASGIRRRTITDYAVSLLGISRPVRVRVCAADPNAATACLAGQEIRTEYEYLGDTNLPTRERRTDVATSQSLDTLFTYDSEGRLLSTDGPLAGTDDATYNRYDIHGRKTWEIGALAANGLRIATRITYRDSDDKPVIAETGTITDAASTTLTVIRRTDLAYDARRNAVREAVSGAGTTFAVTDRAFDNRNLPVCQTQRMNGAHFPLNGAGGSLPADACTADTSGTQGPDRITSTSYDAAGQKLQVREGVGTADVGTEATWAYGLNGQIITVIDGNGNRAELHYDGHMRQDRWTFPSATRPGEGGTLAYNDASQASALATAGSVNAADYEEYGYDAAGNRTSLRRRDELLLQYQYDNLNRLLAKLVPERPTGPQALTAAQTRDVYYGYDLRDAQLFARFDSAAATSDGVTNVYDGYGRLTSSAVLMDGVSRSVGSIYDAGSRRTQVIQPDGFTFTYAYDGASRLTGLYQGADTSVMLDTFTWNAQGLPAGRTERYGSSVAYGYDNAGRPTSQADTLLGAGADVSRSFGYTPAGQLGSVSRTNDAYAWTGHYAVQRAYTTNGLNQYTNAGGAGFSYDKNGNLISDGTRTFTYDVENRLVAASGGVTLRYDPLGRLYEVASPSGTRRFVWDGDALVSQYNGAGAMTDRFVHGPNAGADDPLMWYDLNGYGLNWLHADQQGSITGVANGFTGTRINAYDEYGIPNASNAGLFQYTGQLWLPELGLYHYKARIYSPTLGRFLQTDPIGYAGGSNLYGYVGDDPVNSADPSGLAPAVIGWCAENPVCNRFAQWLLSQIVRGLATSIATPLIERARAERGPIYFRGLSGRDIRSLMHRGAVLPKRPGDESVSPSQHIGGAPSGWVSMTRSSEIAARFSTSPPDPGFTVIEIAGNRLPGPVVDAARGQGNVGGLIQDMAQDDEELLTPIIPMTAIVGVEFTRPRGLQRRRLSATTRGGCPGLRPELSCGGNVDIQY